MRRIISIVLAVLMMAMIIPSEAFAATKQDSKAITMTLEKTEGTVIVLNAAGKEVSIKNGGKLRNGYSVRTTDGYAWIGLDDSKLIKMDWDSEVSFRKKGKKLEVLLEDGKLFFNVNKPLETDETLNIRTSTMTTGIRGTFGILSLVAHKTEETITYRTVLAILDGTGHATYLPLRGMELVTETVNAGESLTLQSEILTGESKENEIPIIPSEKIMTEENMMDLLQENPFVVVEFEEDESLKTQLIENNIISEEEYETIAEKLEESVTQKQEQQTEEREQIKEENKAIVNQTQSEQPKKTEYVNFKNIEEIIDGMQEAMEQQAGQEVGEQETESSTTPTAPIYHTIEYQVEGDTAGEYVVFARQKIQDGKAPQKAPTLIPDGIGSYWYCPEETPQGGRSVAYDFTKPISKDITLRWEKASD